MCLRHSSAKVFSDYFERLSPNMPTKKIAAGLLFMRGGPVFGSRHVFPAEVPKFTADIWIK